MQYLNDDMDELFRRAAEGYALKLQEEGWDAVAVKLSTANVIAAGVDSKKDKRNNYRFAILALLFLVISETALLFVLNNENKNFKNNTAFKESNEAKPGDKYFSVSNEKNRIAPTSTVRNSINPAIAEKITLTKVTKEILVYPDTKINITKADISYTDELIIKNKELGTKENKLEDINTNLQSLSNENTKSKIQQIQNKDNIKAKQEVSNTAEKNLKNNTAKKDKRFYVGIVAGPQFNQVKNQGFSNPGFSAGLLTGFSITKKIAVETGFIISQKKYFSSGEYFSMKTMAASMPAGMKVVSLNGKSTVLEIPIKIKYNFQKKNRGSFFSTAGVSSYILTKESNKYLAEINGNRQKITGNYSNNGKYFNAALNISAGYEYKIKQTRIRIEPYVQVPLKGIGVGSMPVMSTGIYVGVTLPFH